MSICAAVCVGLGGGHRLRRIHLDPSESHTTSSLTDVCVFQMGCEWDENGRAFWAGMSGSVASWTSLVHFSEHGSIGRMSTCPEC